MKKRLVRVLAGGLAIGVLLALAVAAILRPPPPLPQPERGFTLDGVTWIVPGEGGARAEHQRIVGRGSEIAEIGPAGPGADGPYAGAFVTPGLADLHVHFPPAAIPGQAELFAFLHLLHGVTSVRDAGDTDGTGSGPARDGLRAGAFPGPRIVSCGYFLDGAEPLWKNSLRVTSPDEGRAAVRRVVAEGFECVKAYNGLDRASLDAIRDEAHRAGVSVIGHTPMRVPYDEARLDDAQHLIGIAPPFEGVPPRFPLMLAAWLRLDDARREAMIDAALLHGIANTPTLVTIDRLIGSRHYERMLDEPDAHLLPRFYREVVWSPVEGINAARGLSDADFDMLVAAMRAMRATVKRMHERGVTLHTGTDALVSFVVPGAALHRELRLLVEAGLSPEEALALSMQDQAAVFGVPRLGEIAPGAPADLLIFREDPTRSLDALDGILAVVRDGRLYPRAELDAQLERYRAHFDGTLYDALVTPLVRFALSSTRPD